MISLADYNSKLLEEWDYQNNNISPYDVSYGSEKKVWWICNKKHSYEAMIINRANGTGCPYCSGRKILKGYNDLTSTNPKLVKEWNYKKNNILPTEVSQFSNKKVWWICNKNHEWEASVSNRTSGTGCPYCSGRKILKGYNDLKSQYPIIASEWDYEKNNNEPDEVISGSAKKVWWKCNKGHNYQAEIRSRVKGDNCPFCSGHQIVIGFNDLTTTHPELLKEWDYEKNNILPTQVSKGSAYKAWWRCQYNHSWQTEVYHRTRNRGCPFCNNSKQTSFPEQALYFYLSKIYNNVENRYKKIFNNGMELDIFIKDINVAIEYDGRFFHSSQKSLIREKAKYEICKTHNIKLIRMVENGISKDDNCDKKIGSLWNNGNYKDLDNSIIELFNYLNIDSSSINTYFDRLKIMNLYKTKKSSKFVEKNVHILEEWDYEKNKGLVPEMFECKSGIKVWWKCKKGHSWQAQISKRNNGNNCPYCSNKKILEGYNDLATINPDLLKEWDYEKNDILPTQVTKCSGKKVWWKCEKGHSWQAQISKRNNGNNCPYCSNKKILEGYNDLATINPDLLKEWDYEKNDILPTQVSECSNKNIWWKCEKGHSWQARVSKRNNGNNCPYCSNKKILEGYNDLATINPDLLKEWDYEKNDILPTQVTKCSGKKVWWKCEKGHSWQTAISNRFKGSGCLYCCNQKVLEGYNDLATINPNLLKEWDYEKNDILPTQVTKCSGKKVWWKCEKGHSWLTAINNKSKGTRCPFCKP